MGLGGRPLINSRINLFGGEPNRLAVTYMLSIWEGVANQLGSFSDAKERSYVEIREPTWFTKAGDWPFARRLRLLTRAAQCGAATIRERSLHAKADV